MTKGKPTPLLKMWLGAMYLAKVLKHGDYDETRTIVRQRLEADQDLRKEAEELRTALRPVVKARPNSHIEKAQLEYLDDVLSKETL